MALTFGEIQQKQAGMDREQLAASAQAATIGSPTYKPISIDQMQPQTAIQLPNSTVNTTGADAMVAGTTQSTKTYADYIKQATPPQTEASKSQDAILGRLLELSPELGGKKAALAQKEVDLGLPELNKQQAALNADVLSQTAEYNVAKANYEKLLTQAEDRVASLGSIRGRQAQIQRNQASDLNLKASSIALTQARALGMQGQVEAAQKTAARAIDLQFESKEDEYNLKLRQLELIQPLLNKEQTIQANALQRMYQDEQAALAEQKEKSKTLFNLGITSGVTKPFFLVGNMVVRTSDGKGYATPSEAAKDGVDTKNWSNVQQINPGGAGNFTKIGETVDEYGNSTDMYGFVNTQTGKITPANSFGGNYIPSQNGSLVSSNPIPSKVINGYDFTSYATDPNWGNSVNSILSKIPAVGSLAVGPVDPRTPSSLDGYIKKVAPKSSITSQMIVNASQKFNVDPKLLSAILQQESQFGTAGKGARTFNPGNVGNTDSGAEVNYGNWQAGVNAVAQNMAKRQIANQANNPTLNSNDPKSIAQTIFNGTGRISDISVKNNLRTRVSAELDKLKNQALDSGDIYGTIRASAGGKDVDTTFIQAFEKGVNVLYQLSDLQKAIEGQATGPIMGIIRSNNPYDTKAQQIKAQLQALVPNLARGIYGEVGVLTDNDVANYAKTLPNLKSTEEVREAILALTLKSVQRSLENKIRTAAGFGRDVSGILDLYKQIEGKVKEIETGQDGGDSDFRSWLTSNGSNSLDSLLSNNGF
jgi:hypothetical protein